MCALLIGILLSFWVHPLIKKQGGEPWGWIVGILLVWPIFSIIIGIKYKSPALTILGSSVTGAFLLWMIYVVATEGW